MPSLRATYEVGLDFIEFLGERKSKKDKKELRDIYNFEFKRERGPSFSKLFYALLYFNLASLRQGKVTLHAKPQVRLYYCDQWKIRTHSKPTPSSRPDHEPSRAPDSGQSAPHSAPIIKPVLTPKRKLAQEILQKLRTNRPQLISDKGGITITSTPVSKNGKVLLNIDLLDTVYVVKFQIVNKGQKCIHFTFYTALHKIRCFTLVSERRVSRVSPLLLCPGEKMNDHFKRYLGIILYQTYSCIYSHSNHYTNSIFHFHSTLSSHTAPHMPFSWLLLHPSLPAATSLCNPAYFSHHSVNPRSVANLFLLLLSCTSSFHHVSLSCFLFPDVTPRTFLAALFITPAVVPQSSSTSSPSLSPCLTSSLNFTLQSSSFSFHHLILFEVIALFELWIYCCGFIIFLILSLSQVPGVAENRPSVLRGDSLNVYLHKDMAEPITVYKGYVHRVELENVQLGFSNKLVKKFITNMTFNVEFSFNRFPLKLQHRAVQLVAEHRLGNVLFPTRNGVKQTALPNLRIYNRDLENNPEQKAAVQHILSGYYKPAPYMIFGPPGTGKTVTLVEAIKQVNKTGSSVHVLACAPSNSACDLLCERLLGFVDAHRLFRLYACSRDPSTVPQKLLKYSNWVESQGSFILPSQETLMDYTIIVVTLITAGRLVSGGIPVGHFTHIFIDEAGQAVEPECVVGIAGLLHPETGQLVLAGDPKQLGPILRSPLAQKYGLGLSLLERLMTQNSLYQKNQDGHQGYDSCYVTKLLRNYRSHPAVLKIPNELFYENELQVYANQMEREAFCQWEHLPKQGFPVIFHGVMGKDEREANSPSFFNVSEIEVLINYLKNLLLSQGKKGLPKLSANDIGIIAPYRKQVEKMRKALKSVRELQQWKDIKVGSVEEFQGQEKMVIMVSAVRSSNSYVKMDQDFNIGFLTNEKRFNVAMTRAKALLIVTGNPVILSKNPTWKSFLQYCEQEQGYTGFDYKEFEGEDDVVTRLASLKIHTSTDEIEESAVQQHVHPEWRNE
ncbi:putative helicase mov-10-B.1, partial [Silurus asotus]